MSKPILYFLVALAALPLAAGCRTPGRALVSVPDRDITTSVKDRLAADPASDFTRVNVETRNGTVTLTGIVGLWAEHTRAERHALKVGGVTAVINRLELEPLTTPPAPADVPVSDPDITAVVQSALAADPAANFGRVHVDTTEGMVTLTGAVDLWAERTRAEELTLRIQAVKGVMNRLRVEPPELPR